MFSLQFTFAEEFGFGADICDAFGYGYWLIDQMHVIVDFVPKGAATGVDISKLASSAEKEAAAAVALAHATAAKKVKEEADKAAYQAAIDNGTLDEYKAAKEAAAKVAEEAAKKAAETKDGATTDAAKPATEEKK